MRMGDSDRPSSRSPLDAVRAGAWGTLAFIALLAGCNSTYQMDVGSAYGPGLKFDEQGSTYAWLEDSRETGDPALDNPSLHRMIVSTIEDELAAKGYDKTQPESADFWVDYRLGAEQRGDPYGIQEDVFTEYTKGTLAVYVLNPKDKRWIWRAWAQARVHEDMTPEDRKKRLKEAVRRMFEKVRSKNPPK